jgi:hypothetical protein
MPDDIAQYSAAAFMPSRIPARDAVEAFFRTGVVPEAETEALLARTGVSRCYPVEGGHWLRVLYEGGEYDAQRFRLLPGGWDHEHCDRCGGMIAPMALCWVTRDDPDVVLDEPCARDLFGETLPAFPRAWHPWHGCGVRPRPGHASRTAAGHARVNE